MARLEFEAIGTSWVIRSANELPQALRREVFELIIEFDQLWSRFRADSMVSALARASGAASASASLTPSAAKDAAAMLSCYLELSKATGGRISPLIGQSLSALGYDRDFAELSPSAELNMAAKPAITDWADSLTLTGTQLQQSAPALIDIGALGKGLLVDRVFELLAEVPGELLVDAGADQRFRELPARIALEHPLDITKAVGVVLSPASGAIAASATNRRRWGAGKYHHIIDGLSGAPVQEYLASWVGAESAMRADALATALFFPGGAELAEEWSRHEQIWWLRMTSSGSLEWSHSFAALTGAELFVDGWNND